jgi:hypothetical protein
MDQPIGRELSTLQRLTTKELRTKYAETFGESTNANNRMWLIKRIAWRLQALAEGGLTERARQRAAELANDADLRLMPPKNALAAASATEESDSTQTMRIQKDNRIPPPGSVITRNYKGELLQVRVLQQGFEYDGSVYQSLSAVAKAITGSHYNGFLFFKLDGKGNER